MNGRVLNTRGIVLTVEKTSGRIVGNLHRRCCHHLAGLHNISTATHYFNELTTVPHKRSITICFFFGCCLQKRSRLFILQMLFSVCQYKFVNYRYFFQKSITGSLTLILQCLVSSRLSLNYKLNNNRMLIILYALL